MGAPAPAGLAAAIRQHAGAGIDATRSSWRRLTAFQKRFVGGLLWGVVIMVAMMAFHDNLPLQRANDWGLDVLIRVAHAFGVDRDRSVPFTLIDIDEATYARWNEPIVTPRQDLAKLIAFAVSGKPRAVVVDVDLAKAWAPQDANDGALTRVLRNVGADGPPVILAKTFRNPLPDDPRGYYRPRRSFLEEVVATSPSLHWGSVLFNYDSDGMVRSWRLWEPTCTTAFSDPGPEPRVIPSVQLVVLALTADPAQFRARAPAAGPGALYDPLEIRLTRTGLASCGKSGALSGPPEATLDLGGLKLRLQPDHLAERIVYTLPWATPATPEMIKVGDKVVPNLTVRSAVAILDRDQQQGTATAQTWLEQHVVVIGGSFADSHDMHATPLGTMPGAMIVVNAIQSLLQFKQLGAGSAWTHVAVELALLVLCAWVFAYFTNWVAKTVASLLVLALMLPLSYYFIRDSVWLDFALPLVAINLHSMIVSLENAWHKPRHADSH